MRALLIIILPALVGCGDTASDPPGSDAAPVESTVERGPVTMTVRAGAKQVRVGERLVLTVDVSADNGVDIVMPTVEQELGSFSVRRSETPPDVPEGGRRRYLHTYELDTFAAGDLELPPLTVGFVDRRSGDPLEGELVSDPLVITVSSVLEPDADPMQYRDIKGTVEVPVERSPAARALTAAVIVLGLVALATIWFLVVRRRRQAEASEPEVPAHVWALEQLHRLQEERLIERGDLHGFYVRLSDILRQYIERRFGIMAPERTTEEFLRETRASPVLGDDHSQVLGGFLRAADLVKFALHEPSAAESEYAFEAARRFVKETVPVDDTPAMEAAA